MKPLLVVLSVMIVAASAKVIILNTDLDNYNDIGEHKLKPVSAVVTQELYIPMTLKACDNASCKAACHALGYPNGICVSDTTCDCY